jgi:hypothetical protein
VGVEVVHEATEHRARLWGVEWGQKPGLDEALDFNFYASQIQQSSIGRDGVEHHVTLLDSLVAEVLAMKPTQVQTMKRKP